MRVKQLLLVCTLALSVVAVGPVSPAGATHCRTSFLASMAPPPQANQLVTVGSSIKVDGNVLVDYALTLADVFATETQEFVDCQVAEVGAVVDDVVANVACTQASPGVANLNSANPSARYLTVSGFAVEVHHSVLLADVAAVAACWPT